MNIGTKSNHKRDGPRLPDSNMALHLIHIPTRRASLKETYCTGFADTLRENNSRFIGTVRNFRLQI